MVRRRRLPSYTCPCEELPSRGNTWHSPSPSQCLTGNYAVAVSVWDTEPGDISATRLAYQEQKDSFLVLRHTDNFNTFDSKLWEKSSHQLGLSQLTQDNVDLAVGDARIRIPGGTLDGGEFSSTGYFKYGTYRARMLLPQAAGSVTGFFLYQKTSNYKSSDEIDIELLTRDGRWKIAFTTWLRGAQSNTAAHAGYTAFYIRAPRLFETLRLSRGDGSHLKALSRLSRVQLSIIDDLLLTPMADSERRDLLEVIEDRYQTGAIIIASQFPVKDWHANMGDPTLADAVCDRLLHNAYKLEIRGDSMRTRKPSMSEERIKDLS